MGATNKNMQGISFEKGKELLTNFPCSQCRLYLTERDIEQENCSFWFSDYANEITKEGTFYGANFWLKGVDHLECPENKEENDNLKRKYWLTNENNSDFTYETNPKFLWILCRKCHKKVVLDNPYLTEKDLKIILAKHKCYE